MAEQTILAKVKDRFGIEHTKQDEVILDLIEDAENQFMAITGDTEVPTKFEFIIKDVVSIRYNRLSSYGLSSESKGDYSATYQDPQLDFETYYDLLNREYGVFGTASKGRVFFI